VLSPSRRVLLRGGREVALIPRYFDLLLLLVERRPEAVSRREIFDAVWSDVVVSDGALSQAVRTLRRALGDDPREPTFIRTLPRHGYRFVHPGVSEQPDTEPLPEGPLPSADRASAASIPASSGGDAFAPQLERLLAPGPLDSEERRAAAEALHALGTREALRRLDRLPGHARARALLRETRWDAAEAGAVPVLGGPDPVATTFFLLWLRLRRSLRLAGGRWAPPAAGGALAGLVAGLIGGLALRLGPGSLASDTVPIVLAFVGLAIGGLGAIGVGAGLAAAEVLVRSFRGVALVALGAAGGGLIGAGTHLLGDWTIRGLFGRDLSPVAGGLEGLVLGAAAGLGYALATAGVAGMATPHGWARARALLATGLCCALAAATLAATGSYLGAMSLDFVARAFPGSQVGLAPLSRLLGEQDAGLRTRLVISSWEGLLFGAGLVLGLTRRPRPAPGLLS
jgi:DNA-binding winged helix-turn-helix (wHTH) protein